MWSGAGVDEHVERRFVQQLNAYDRQQYERMQQLRRREMRCEFGAFVPCEGGDNDLPTSKASVVGENFLPSSAALAAAAAPMVENTSSNNFPSAATTPVNGADSRSASEATTITTTTAKSPLSTTSATIKRQPSSTSAASVIVVLEHHIPEMNGLEHSSVWIDGRLIASAQQRLWSRRRHVALSSSWELLPLSVHNLIVWDSYNVDIPRYFKSHKIRVNGKLASTSPVGTATGGSREVQSRDGSAVALMNPSNVLMVWAGKKVRY